MHADVNSKKLRITLIILGGCGQKWAWNFNFIARMNLADFLHANTYLRKVKVMLIVNGWAWSNMDVSF